MNHSLIADLKDLLRDALKADDYANVRKFAGYLEELLGEKAPTKRAKHVKPANEEKVAKKRGRPAKAKPVKEVTEAVVVAEKAAAKPAKAPKKAPKETPKKAPKKVKKAKKAKPAKKVKAPKAKPVEKVAGKPRGLARFTPGSKLTTQYKGEELILTVLEGNGIEHKGTAYPNLAQFVDAFAGKNQANHLRAIGTWKVVE